MGGAPRGNRNALKHGIYARSFTPEENETLDHARADTRDEIKSLRVQALRVSTWLKGKGPEDFGESYFRAMNTLVNINMSIGTLLRTESLIAGTSSAVEKAIEEAVLSKKERWILA